MKRICLTGVCLLVMVVGLFGGLFGCAAPAPEKEITQITWTTYDLGSATYPNSAYVADAILKTYNVRVRVLPAASEVTRLAAARGGTADFFLTGGGAWFAQEGLMEFAALDWGPQVFDMCFMGIQSGLSMMVRGNSDIKTIKDLKGKRVSYAIGSPANNMQTAGILAAADLTWADVVRVDYSSFGASTGGPLEGSCDAVPNNTNSAAAYTLEASPHGIRWLEIPNDAATWAKVKKYWPYSSSYRSSLGAGVSKDKPIWMGNYWVPTWAIYPKNYDKAYYDELCYFQTKSIVETYDTFKVASDTVRELYTLDAFLGLINGSGFPIAEGTIKYLKEIGKWTAENQKAQDENLRYRAKLAQLWQETVDEAVKQGIKSADFTNLWLKKREAAGLIVATM